MVNSTDLIRVWFPSYAGNLLVSRNQPPESIAKIMPAYAFSQLESLLLRNAWHALRDRLNGEPFAPLASRLDEQALRLFLFTARSNDFGKCRFTGLREFRPKSTLGILEPPFTAGMQAQCYGKNSLPHLSVFQKHIANVMFNLDVVFGAVCRCRSIITSLLVHMIEAPLMPVVVVLDLYLGIKGKALSVSLFCQNSFVEIIDTAWPEHPEVSFSLSTCSNEGGCYA